MNIAMERERSVTIWGEEGRGNYFRKKIKKKNGFGPSYFI
jgi:hypothetical protein